MFLTREQLKSMTNAKRPKEIVAWLQQHAPGRYRLGVDGWPVVHEKVAEELFGVGAGPRGKRRVADVSLAHLKGGHGTAENKGQASS